MREIKFRCYSTVTGSFDYFTIKDLLTNECRKVSEKAFDEDLYVEQFTGLKDVNGVEIYEGDIVDCKSSYNDGVNIIELKSVEVSTTSVDGVMLGSVRYRYCGQIKVIGNIHQNPELLED